MLENEDVSDLKMQAFLQLLLALWILEVFVLGMKIGIGVGISAD